MDFLIGFLFGVFAIAGYLHATKHCKTGKRAALRNAISGNGGGGGGGPQEPL